LAVAFFVCFTPAENLLIIATILLASSYLRFIHRLISRYLPSPAEPPIPPPPIQVARSARSGAYCNAALPKPSNVSIIYDYMSCAVKRETRELMQFQHQISLIESNTLRHISRFLHTCSLSIYPSPPPTRPNVAVHHIIARITESLVPSRLLHRIHIPTSGLLHVHNTLTPLSLSP
jgi:hypothetical protein